MFRVLRHRKQESQKAAGCANQRISCGNLKKCRSRRLRHELSDSTAKAGNEPNKSGKSVRSSFQESLASDFCCRRVAKARSQQSGRRAALIAAICAATCLVGIFRQRLFWLRLILRFDSSENPPSARFASFIFLSVSANFSGSFAQRF